MQERHLYEYAVIRFVPKVEREEFINMGIVLFSKQAKYLMSQVGTPYGGTQSMAPASPVTKEQREAAIAENTKRFRANIPV